MMKSIRSKDTAGKSSIDVKGTKAIFENGMRRQRAPSPAPVSMTARSPLNSRKNSGSSTISSYKERFEIFTAPKKDSEPTSTLRRAASENNVAKSSVGDEAGGGRSRERARSNSVAEGHWFQARTKIYEQLSHQRSQSDKDLPSNSAKSTFLFDRKKSDNRGRLPEDKTEPTSISDRINRYKSDVETKKKSIEKFSTPNEKTTITVKDIKSTFVTHKADQQSSKVKSATFLDKCKKLGQSLTGDNAKETGFSSSSATRKQPKKSPEPKLIKPPLTLPCTKTNSVAKQDDIATIATENDSKAHKLSRDQKESATKPTSNHKHHQKSSVIGVTDITTARHFMDELIAAIDNEQHVPMKQLVNLFETMKKENGEMKEAIESLKVQLNKKDIDRLSEKLEQRLADTTEELERAQAQIQELSAYREALTESEERCEELEELNNQYLEEIDELKLVMNEMRDQFHDDEVHETIILQQRLDDMARSLRIIHFRLKKADAKLQETEREKETLLEEVKLLQGGAFTDEEIRRMQSLEGDLQSAKEISIELHNRLQRSEERREMLERESHQLRDEIKASDLENDRLRNNILHLRDQVIII